MAEDLDYRRSSYSGQGANCVEAAACDTGVSVRDSKDPAGPTIEFTHRQWALFVDEILNQQPNNNGAVTVSIKEIELTYADGPKVTCWHLHALKTGEVLHFTGGERDAFVCGAKDGEFTYRQVSLPVGM